MGQGIFGILDFDRRIDNPDDFVRNATEVIVKEGGRHGKVTHIFNQNYLLLMKRTIIDSTQQQSEIARNKGLQSICSIHGEVHNYIELTKEVPPEDDNDNGDLDLIIRLYRRYGLDFALKLNGLFSLAILDEQNSSLILLNDRFGLAHQVYWTQIGSRFYFSTHLKILLTLPEIKRDVDPEGLNLFLKYSYIPSPWTIFKGIRKLSAGNLLLLKNKTVQVTSYWEFPTSNNHRMNTHEAVTTYRILLRKSVARRLGRNEKVGILLSGGLDSSANVALAAESADQKLKTFSVGFEDPVFDERPYARIVSRHFNTQHFETVVTGHEIEDLPKLVWHLEEPYFEFGLFLTYKGLEAARNEVDAVIGGEGTDQLFGTGGFTGGRPAALHYLLSKYRLLGLAREASSVFKNSYCYNQDNLAFKLRMFWNRAIDLNDWYFYGYDQHELLQLYKDPKIAVIPKIFSDLSVNHDLQSTARQMSFHELFLQTQINQDLKHYVNENVMVKSGRMADMLNITLRETYLDTEVTDFLTSLDYSLKRSGNLLNHITGNVKTKYLHRKAMEGLLPIEIMAKPKQGGFVPVMIFLKNQELRKKIYHHLLNSDIINEYFQTDFLRNLFEDYERLQKKVIYWHNFYNSKANRILFLLTFDIWHHLYIEQNPWQFAPVSLSNYLNRAS